MRRQIAAIGGALVLLSGCGTSGGHASSSPSGRATPTAAASSVSLGSFGTRPAETPPTAWLARADSIIEALGYPVPGDGVVGQERDTATGAMNTVAHFGTTWQVDWDPDGTVTFVFRTASPTASAPVANNVASARVVVVAAALNYAIPTRSIPLTFGGDLWSAVWPRTVDGVPAIGDDTGITLYADGSFAGFHRLNRALEPKPRRILTRTEAEAAFLAARGSQSLFLPQIIGAELEWAPPNPPGIEPSPALRLCWVLTLKPPGNVPNALARAVLDAATGVELWGDSTAT